MDCSTYFVRDPQILVRVMSTNPSYLQTATDGQVTNYRDWGLPLGRRMRALKLWFVIRDQGVQGLQARIRRDLAQAQWLAARSQGAALEAPRTREAADAGRAPRAAGARAVRHRCADARVRAGYQRFGRGLSHATALLDGHWAVRVSLGGANTEHEHVANLWRLMQQKVGA